MRHFRLAVCNDCNPQALGLRISRLSVVLLWLLSLVLTPAAYAQANSLDKVDDLHDYWNYRQPEASEARFKALLEVAKQSDNPYYYPVLLTQIARTYSLRGDFDTAQDWLELAQDNVEGRDNVAWAYVLLESGRVYNSGGDKPRAVTYFEEAFRVSELAGDDFVAVDAAHMVAIAEALPNQMKWNLIALGIAETSDNPRARDWRGSLYNNIGWTYFEQGKYAEALPMFEKAVVFRGEKNQQRRLQVARWSVARTHRALGNEDIALDMQLTLEEQIQEVGAEPDGFVFEEIGELLLSRDKDRARRYFARAHALLSADEWFASHEAERLARIKRLSLKDES